jgi:acyl-CoA synthetase (AMP-forming)/AMP-acid ligase II
VDPLTNKSLPVGYVGELYVKSDTVTQGYLRNPDASAEALTSDGWLRTGDLGRFDADHHFFLLDRAKEMIKCNSFQISPTEIELHIGALEGVQEVIVVGVPDDRCGQKPVALVVKEKGAKITEDDIKQHVSSKLNAFERFFP